MGQRKHVDASFFVLVEDEGFFAPPAVIFYEWYEDSALLKQQLEAKRTQLQVVYASEDTWATAQRFGTAQTPALDDYADGIDTMRFLEHLSLHNVQKNALSESSQVQKSDI